MYVTITFQNIITLRAALPYRFLAFSNPESVTKTTLTRRKKDQDANKEKDSERKIRYPREK
jgi:hypothetical protein